MAYCYTEDTKTFNFIEYMVGYVCLIFNFHLIKTFSHSCSSFFYLLTLGLGNTEEKAKRGARISSLFLRVAPSEPLRDQWAHSVSHVCPQQLLIQCLHYNQKANIRIFWMSILRLSHLLFLPKFRLVGLIVLALVNSALRRAELLLLQFFLIHRSTGRVLKRHLNPYLDASSTWAHYESIMSRT